MSQAQAIPPVLSAKVSATVYSSAKAASIPWTIWFMVGGIASGMIGGIWDISWHMSIGRDSFWTPAHILIQLTGVFAGIACAYAILGTTFSGASSAREASVQVLGFRAPVGAFIAVWGCVAMLASAPFDNWWHNAYGLDVKIVSPPHVLLSLGSFAVKVGAMAWIASIINQSHDRVRGGLKWLFLFVGATGLSHLSLMIIEPTWLVQMHTAACYLAVALVIPAIVIASGWGAAHRWGCTIVAAIYTLIALGEEWLLPLFPAQPKLGPVYHNVTHLVPLRFPLLLIVPAVICDLLLRRLKERSPWTKAIWIGPAFVLSFMAAQWPFANFLISHASRNWVFGTAYFGYFDPAGFLYDPYKFVVGEPTLGAFLLKMALAVVAAIVTTRLGLAWGDWMRRVRR
jgi:hypothetical protein